MLNHVVVPLDGSELAQTALDHALKLLDTGSQLTLLMVLQPEEALSLSDFYPSTFIPRTKEDEINTSAAIARAHNYLSRLAEDITLEHPYNVRVRVEVGEPASVITDIAEAFQKVTGHPARYIDTDLDAYWNGPLKGLADLPAGYNADPNDKSTMSFRDNFTGFWNVWKYGKVSRNYDLLDEVHPNRIRSAEQWFRREDQLGRELGKGTLWDRVQPENQTIDSVILKGSADLRTGTL